MRDLVALPKAHLHVHLEGALRPATLTELAAGYGIDVPPVRGFGSFTEFSGMIHAACEVLKTPDDLRRVVFEVVEDAALDGAAYVEPSTSPFIHADRLGSEDEILEMTLEFLAAAGARFGIGVGLMVAADRTLDPSLAVEHAKLAVRYADRGVVGFGLHNDEAGFPPEPFAEAFRLTNEAGLLSTPHAGELDGPSSVRGALDSLAPNRLQHGVRAIEDPSLVARLADEGVCCDVCPTSNVLLAVVPAMEACALGALLDAGVPCSVNADDPLLFGPGLLDEYELCRSSLGFSDERLAQIARFSLEHSGASAEVKASALAGIDAWLTT